MAKTKPLYNIPKENKVKPIFQGFSKEVEIAGFVFIIASAKTAWL
jgi:hypothetical protein